MQKEIIQIGQLQIRFVMDAVGSKGSVSAFELTVPAGAKVPLPHYHREFDETIYGLAGELTMTVEGARKPICAGDSLFIPRGAIHGFTNEGTADAKALAVITPARLGPEYFMELATAVSTGGPPDPAVIKGIMTKHGLVPVPPQG